MPEGAPAIFWRNGHTPPSSPLIISLIFLRSRMNRDLAICFYVAAVGFLRSRPIIFLVCRDIWLGPDPKNIRPLGFLGTSLRRISFLASSNNFKAIWA